MNNVQLIGRTRDDIELRYTSKTQTAVGSFTLCVDRMKKEDGTDFIRCKVWGKRAEVMEKFVKKGHKVGITGRIETGSYKNKDDVTVYTTDVIVENFDFLEPRHGEQSSSQQTPPEANTPQEANTPPEVDEEIPDGFAYLDEDLPF